MTKRRIHAEPRRYWTKVEERLLRRVYPHQPTADLVAMFPGRTLSTLYQRAYRLGLSKTEKYLNSPAAHRLDGIKGMGTRFPKGNVPMNKGLRRPGWGPGRMKQTQFKKGNYSKRWDREVYCVGALRINADGGLDIKIKEGLRAWESLARFTWRTERGRIPKKGIVRPINGDLHDTRIENLRLGTKADVMRENTYHNYPKPIARLIQLRGAIVRQINRREGQRAK